MSDEITELKEQLLVAQDMIDTVIQQRDAANNMVVQMSAQLKKMERAASAKAPNIALPQNGHDAEAAALN